MNFVLDSSVIPYLFYIGIGVFSLVVLFLVYTGRRERHII